MYPTVSTNGEFPYEIVARINATLIPQLAFFVIDVSTNVLNAKFPSVQLALSPSIVLSVDRVRQWTAPYGNGGNAVTRYDHTWNEDIRD